VQRNLRIEEYMAVKIRLTRIGRKKSPVYRVIATDGRNKRDGAALEVLGTYDPIKGNIVQFHEERIAFWVAQGAVETDAVKKIRRMHLQAASATNVA